MSKAIPISPLWDDIRSYGEIKEKALFTIFDPVSVRCVAIVLEQDGVNLNGVIIGHDRFGITVNSEFSAWDDRLVETAIERGGYITRNTDRAVRDFLTRANAF